MGRGASDWSKAVAEIETRSDLPESMDFFYSKWSVLWDVVIFTSLTVAMLGLNFLWLWSPVKQPSDSSAAILLGVIFLPFTIFFGLKAKSTAAILINIEDPAVKICRTGCQYANRVYPWVSIESINTTGFRAPFLVVRHTVKNDGKQEKFTVNLSLLSQRHLPEYMRKYWSTFGSLAKRGDNKMQY
jgi:hypothetical protein